MSNDLSLWAMLAQRMQQFSLSLSSCSTKAGNNLLGMREVGALAPATFSLLLDWLALRLTTHSHPMPMNHGSIPLRYRSGQQLVKVDTFVKPSVFMYCTSHEHTFIS